MTVFFPDFAGRILGVSRALHWRFEGGAGDGFWANGAFSRESLERIAGRKDRYVALFLDFG